MPRDGGGVYSKPSGTTAVFGTTIESTKYNLAIDDFVTDANTVRPIAYGGTGAANAAAALSALGAFPIAGGTLSGALNEAPIVSLASASTIDIGAAAANTILVTGTTPITALGTIAAGAIRRLVFDNVLTLTHNAVSLILPGSASIVTAQGDAATFLSLGSGNWRCIGYQPASGNALIPNVCIYSPTTGNAGKDISVREGLGATILIPPARYKMADYLSGGVPSGVAATDTTAYNAVLASIIAAGGKRILELPAGTVRLTNGIQLNAANVDGMAVVGAGRARTILAAQSTTGNDIVVGNTGLSLGRFTLENFSILPSVTKTAGAAVLVNNADRVEINIDILGGFRGIQYENAGGQAVSYVENPYITGLSEDAFVFGLSQLQFANGIWVNSGIVGQCRRAATFARASGIHFDGTESYQAGDDAFSFEPVGIGIQGVWMTAVLADSAAGRGWGFKSTAPMAEIYMTSCQAGSCGARGIEVDAGVNLNGLYITDPLVVNTNSSGIRIVAGKQIHILGGQVSHSNGVGIAFENNVTEWSCKNVRSGHLGWFAANGVAARQTTGLFIGTGNNYYEIGGNWYVRNTATGLNNNSSGAANKVIGTDFTI